MARHFFAFTACQAFFFDVRTGLERVFLTL